MLCVGVYRMRAVNQSLPKQAKQIRLRRGCLNAMTKHKKPIRLTKRGKRVRAITILAIAIAVGRAMPEIRQWFNGLDDLEQTQVLVAGFGAVLFPYLYKITN
jgi:hypothetical protein